MLLIIIKVLSVIMLLTYLNYLMAKEFKTQQKAGTFAFIELIGICVLCGFLPSHRVVGIIMGLVYFAYSYVISGVSKLFEFVTIVFLLCYIWFPKITELVNSQFTVLYSYFQ